jgi:hypothetical protein
LRRKYKLFCPSDRSLAGETVNTLLVEPLLQKMPMRQKCFLVGAFDYRIATMDIMYEVKLAA